MGDAGGPLGRCVGREGIFLGYLHLVNEMLSLFSKPDQTELQFITDLNRRNFYVPVMHSRSGN